MVMVVSLSSILEALRGAMGYDIVIVGAVVASFYAFVDVFLFRRFRLYRISASVLAMAVVLASALESAFVSVLVFGLSSLTLHLLKLSLKSSSSLVFRGTR